MSKINRRQMIKKGAAGALAVGAVSAGSSPANAAGRRGLFVHIHGVLVGAGPPVEGITLAVSIDAAGRPEDLAGAGWDSGTEGTAGMVPGPGPTPTSGPVGACYYTVAGNITNGFPSIVTLKGRSLFTNRPLAFADPGEPGRSDTRADGREVNVVANADTGEIFWRLGIAAFTGTGVVTVIHAAQSNK